MSNVVEISKPFAPDDICSGLRNLADKIEAGEFGLNTTCVVLLGHTADKPGEGGDKVHCMDFETFGSVNHVK